MADALIRAEGVRKVYRMDSVETEVLRGVDLTIGRRGVMAIVGASGAGKSTLLHVLSSLDPPTAGRVLFEGRDLYAMGEEALAGLRNDTFGFIFQFHHLMPEFTALENVLMPLLIRGESKTQAQKKSLELLENLGLKDRTHHRPTELSGGEQQRVAVARALVTSPKALFADEPTGNLDPENGERLMDLLLSITREREMALVMVTHNAAIADRFPEKIRMVNGRVVERSGDRSGGEAA